MKLDSELQRKNLLAVLDNVILSSGTVNQLRPQIEEIDKLKAAITGADINEVVPS